MGVSMRPLHDRVLVRQLDHEEKTAGGIIIPDSAKEKPYQGKVVKVGPGRKNEDGEVTPLTLKEGDLVLFEKYAGTVVKLDGEDYMIMREDEVLAIIG